MTTNRAYKENTETLTAPIAEIMKKAPRTRVKKAKPQEQDFWKSALTWADGKIAAGKNLFQQKPVRLGLAGFGAGVLLVTAALKMRKA